jgi:hypothetical protein
MKIFNYTIFTLLTIYTKIHFLKADKDEIF